MDAKEALKRGVGMAFLAGKDLGVECGYPLPDETAVLSERLGFKSDRAYVVSPRTAYLEGAEPAKRQLVLREASKANKLTRLLALRGQV